MQTCYNRIATFAIALLFALQSNLINTKPVACYDTAEESYLCYEPDQNPESEVVAQELDAIAEADQPDMVYVPQNVSEAVEAICNNCPTSYITPEISCVNEAATKAVPAVSWDCAMQAVDKACEALRSPDCMLECGKCAELATCLEQYKKDVENRDATICVKSESTRSRRRCKVFCKLLVRDFLDTRDLAVAGCLRTRAILATGNVCVQGNLLVKGNLKVEGQICGLTGIRGATGPTGVCVCPTGITGAGFDCQDILDCGGLVTPQPCGCGTEVIYGTITPTFGINVSVTLPLLSLVLGSPQCGTGPCFSYEYSLLDVDLADLLAGSIGALELTITFDEPFECVPTIVTNSLLPLVNPSINLLSGAISVFPTEVTESSATFQLVVPTITGLPLGLAEVNTSFSFIALACAEAPCPITTPPAPCIS